MMVRSSFGGKVFIALVFCVSLSYFYIWRDSSGYRSISKPTEWCPLSPPPVTLQNDHFPRSYRRGIIRPRFKSKKQKSISIIKTDNFLSEEQVIPGGILSSRRVADVECESVPVATVDVQPDPKEDHTGDLLLGVATDIDRIEAAFDSLSHFLGNTNASLLAVVPPTKALKQKEMVFRNRGLDVTLIDAKLPYEQRYFSLIRNLRHHIDNYRPETKWVGIIEDETFYPSLHQMAGRLASLSHGRYHYIGALSEAAWAIRTFGIQAFGGAGAFLSVTLLDALEEIYEQCPGEKVPGPDMPGDSRIAACVDKFDPTVNLTTWDELRQWDIRGNPDGIFESGKKIWSFRNSVEHSNVDLRKMSAISRLAGENSVLQRWMFGRSGMMENEKREFYVFNNGYSIVHYTLEPRVPEINFDETESTWNQDVPGYEEALGPFRSSHVQGITKKTWYLRDAMQMGNNMHQFYESNDGGNRDIIEIVWLGQS